MTTSLREAAQMALDALIADDHLGDYAAITALRAALAQPEPIDGFGGNLDEAFERAECCRNELLTALHTLASNYENALGMFGQDGEGRRKAEGDLEHAMKVAAKHNRNGPGCAAPAPAVPVSWDRLRTLMDGIPTREEFIGGQRQKYVAKEAVMSWLHEGQLRAEREAAQPAAPAVQVVLRQPNLFASAPAVPLTDTRKLCTCDGAGRGPGRACVVQAGGRLGDLWQCANGLTGGGNG